MIKLIQNTHRIPEGTPFQTLPAFISNGSYFLTDLKIYKNGLIDCWELVTLDEFVQKIENGWVSVELDSEENYDISIFGLGHISTGFHYHAHKTNQDLVLEVMDILSELNGQQTSSERCYQAWQNYQNEPTHRNISFLKEAYEAIPKHKRIYS